MRPRNERALTGAAAAALLGLDGFRDKQWPAIYVARHSSKSAIGVIRARDFAVVDVDGTDVAHPLLVLRHLGSTLPRQIGRKRRLDLIELAVEDALRRELVTVNDLVVRGGAAAGDAALREVIARRGPAEPPTESYAETVTAQLLRAMNLLAWRQVHVVEWGRVARRADFVVAFRPARRLDRPSAMTPASGLILEIDSVEHHANRFEEDHARQSTYDRLGLHWMTLTPKQVERQTGAARLAILGALARAEAGVPRNRRAS